jgi:hypothetical protein
MMMMSFIFSCRNKNRSQAPYTFRKARTIRDKDKQLESLWKDTGIGNVLPWEDIADEAERLLEMRRAGQDATKEDNDNGEQDDAQEVERDGTDPYDEVIFGRRRPDSVVAVVVDSANKALFVLEFQRTPEQRRDFKEGGEFRARAQHDILIKSLERVAKDAQGENGGWKIKLIVFVGGTGRSVNVKSFNDNMNELHVIESKRNFMSLSRRGMQSEKVVEKVDQDVRTG